MPNCPVTGKIIESKFRINKEDLAWAAAFYNGEGCSTIEIYKDTNPVITIRVSQNTIWELKEFRRCIGGFGKIYFTTKTCRVLCVRKFEQTQAVIAMMWFRLSPKKKEQYILCLEKYRQLYNFDRKSNGYLKRSRNQELKHAS